MAHKPDDKLRAWVRKRVLLGTPFEEIAKGIGINFRTLKKHYEEELKFADEANANVKGMLYKQCMDGNTAAIIFWCKTKLGMKETERRELTGADGKALNLNPVALPPSISREEWLKTYAQGIPEEEGEDNGS